MLRTKDKFMKEMMDTLKSMPLEKRESFLCKVENNWIPSVKAKMKKSMKNYWFCRNCRKYIPLKETKVLQEEELREGVLVYSDSGYGDDDEYGDATYFVENRVCLKCGNKEKIREYLLDVKNVTKRGWF